MTFNDRIDMYKVGIETGIISIDEFTDFIYSEIERLDDVPYIYIDILDAVPMGVKEISKRISDYFFDCRYIGCPNDMNEMCEAERVLIGKIEQRYLCGEFDIKAAAEHMGKLPCYYGLGHGLDAIADDLEMAEKGLYYTFDMIEEELEKIFSLAMYI